MGELDRNFKQVFSFELLLHRCEISKAEDFQYSKILLEKTIAGLNAQGKITIDYSEAGDEYIIKSTDEYKEISGKLNTARKIYKTLANQMGQARSDVTGRAWMDGKVLEMCHLIDAVIYPITMSEGLLDMSETLVDFASQFGAQRPGQYNE